MSQFTLYGRVNKGTKPDFSKAMKTEPSRELYTYFLEKMREAYTPERVLDGKFGAYMQVALVNDGPVTLVIDSKKE